MSSNQISGRIVGVSLVIAVLAVAFLGNCGLFGHVSKVAGSDLAADCHDQQYAFYHYSDWKWYCKCHTR